jgi:hypothetical protein
MHHYERKVKLRKSPTRGDYKFEMQERIPMKIRVKIQPANKKTSCWCLPCEVGLYRSTLLDNPANKQTAHSMHPMLIFKQNFLHKIFNK